MKKMLLAVGAALGGLAFWRRKSLKTDAAKVTEVAKTGVAKVKSTVSDDPVGSPGDDPVTLGDELP